jgi:hypothetical protein
MNHGSGMGTLLVEGILIFVNGVEVKECQNGFSDLEIMND